MTVIFVSRGQYDGYDVPLLSGGAYDLGGNSLTGVGLIQGSTITNQIDDTVGGWDYKAGNGDAHDFIVDGNSIIVIGETVITVKQDIDFDVNDAYDIGRVANTLRFLYIEGGVKMEEGYATGFRPPFDTNTGTFFTVPTAGGKTEARIGFQTGASQVFATEP